MNQPFANQPFSFETPKPEPYAPGEAAHHGPAAAHALQVDRAMAAAGIAAYRWVIEDDVVVWSGNAGNVLGCDPALVASGKAYASFLDPDNFTGRYDVVVHSAQTDNGDGVPFEIECLFRPDGRGSAASVWLEDQGRWFAGPDGRPVEVMGTVRRINDRQARDQHLSFLGNCDPLTGMMNRGRMAEALGEAISVAERDGSSCSLVLAAINNLGVVNEAFGFEIADEVIVSMGRRLRQAVRSGDAIARYSGCKFGIILNNCDEEALAGAIARFLELARESVVETHRGPVWALLSIGAVTLPRHAGDATLAMARAEEALSEARRLPSDGFVLYQPSVERDRQRQVNTEHAMEIVRCLREDRFLLAFQPVVARDDDGRPAYHEALLRMRDSSGTIITAGSLVPIAEKLGLIRLIDRAVVQMAVATLNRYPDARLAINISGTTAIDPRWSPQITSLLAANRDVIDRLSVEITETVALSDIDATRRFVEQLRELGCGVAIDDFGAGFTSFRNLRALPVDILKIDGNFCRDLANNPDHQYFVRALIDLAHAFHFKTVAEWVETEADARLLRDWKVDFMQGNLYGAASLEAPWTAVVDPPQLDLAMTSDDDSEIGWLQASKAAPPASEEPHHPIAAAEEALSPAEPEPQPAPERPGEPAIVAFEDDIAHELSRLRQAIAALDAGFKRKPTAPELRPEPSYADLVSDSVLSRAG